MAGVVEVAANVLCIWQPAMAADSLCWTVPGVFLGFSSVNAAERPARFRSKWLQALRGRQARAATGPAAPIR